MFPSPPPKWETEAAAPIYSSWGSIQAGRCLLRGSQHQLCCLLPPSPTQDHKLGSSQLHCPANKVKERNTSHRQHAFMFRNLKSKNNHGSISEISCIFASGYGTFLWGRGKPIFVPCGFKLSKAFVYFGEPETLLSWGLTWGSAYSPGQGQPFLGGWEPSLPHCPWVESRVGRRAQELRLGEG